MRTASRGALAALGLVLFAAPRARADTPPPPGFLEPIVHWGVQKGETCEDIAKVMYGSATHVPLIQRYNRVDCAGRKSLPEGITLILPKAVTSVPDARIKSAHPDVRGRPSGGAWDAVGTGASLYRNHNVQTMDEGRAHIEFLDHTHVFLAQNTLVVIYGTAKNTRVSKVPPTVELEAGEVQAGLSALRGEPAEVAVPDGGVVRAASRDTVVERKKTRTTVAVFDGKASVQSGGRSVTVPKDFGTRFEGTAPPIPPRPLPPAPRWEGGGSPSVVLAPPGTAVITTSWQPVEKAKAYRLEVSRDEGFHDLVVREEIPADVRSFRAEKMPPGSYRVRVRAIDVEEYLGVASDVRTIEVVAAELRGEGVRFEGKTLTVNPYGVLALAAGSRVEVALDEGPFGPPPAEIDLLKQAPKTLRFRTKSGLEERVTLVPLPVASAPAATFDEASREIRVRVATTGLGGIDIPARVAPRLRLRLGERVETVPLAVGEGGALRASIPVAAARGPAQLDVLDARGRLLGATTLLVPEKPAPPPPRPPSPRHLGAWLPPFRPAGVTAVPWTSPTAPATVGRGLSAGITANGPVFQANGRVSGSFGPLGLDALIVTTPFEQADAAQMPGSVPTEDMAWLGARYLVHRRGASELEIAPLFRIGLPLENQRDLMFDLGAAAGGARGRMTWVANAGARFLLSEPSARIPWVQPYLLIGATYDPLRWLRAYVVADAHVLATIGTFRSVVVPYGLTAGVEAGGSVFLTLSGWIGRAESVTWQAAGTVTGSLGFRLEGEGR
ncbi:FecR domain-containing protein [Polyangium spumosum]|nr:FecR domain-containing protein [Polyangium spumosum]